MTGDLGGSLAGHLAAQAAARPRWPWLIFRDRLDWGWLGFAQVADQVARTPETLTVEPGSRVDVACRLTPEAVASDLAVQAAGGFALPREHVVSLTPKARGRLASWRPRPIDLAMALRGGVGVRAGSGLTLVEASRLVLAAEGFRRAQQLSSKSVALLAGSLEDPGVRIALASSLIAGCAVALEPDADLAAQAVAWVRPHVAVVPSAQLDAVRDAVHSQKARWRRLRLVAAAEGEAIDDSSWAAINVAVATLRP